MECPIRLPLLWLSWLASNINFVCTSLSSSISIRYRFFSLESRYRWTSWHQYHWPMVLLVVCKRLLKLRIRDELRSVCWVTITAVNSCKRSSLETSSTYSITCSWRLTTSKRYADNWPYSARFTRRIKLGKLLLASLSSRNRVLETEATNCIQFFWRNNTFCSGFQH